MFNDVLNQTAHSHTTALMGRTAAYTGKLITNEQMMKSTDLLIDTTGLNFDTPFKARPEAIPGKTKFI